MLNREWLNDAPRSEHRTETKVPSVSVNPPALRCGFSEQRLDGFDGETSDHLQVDAFDGNDRVDVDPAASPVMNLAVDLGLGRL